MLRRKAEKRIVELSHDEARLLRKRFLLFATSYFLPESQQRM